MRISDWSSDVCSSDLHASPVASLPWALFGALLGALPTSVASDIRCPPVRQRVTSQQFSLPVRCADTLRLPLSCRAITVHIATHFATARTDGCMAISDARFPAAANSIRSQCPWCAWFACSDAGGVALDWKSVV